MMEGWVINIYHKHIHPALGQSPAEAFATAMQQAGNRAFKIVPYDELFMIMTNPSTMRGKAKVDSNKGVFINGRYYWSEAFRNSRLDGTSVPVRYDPFNMGIAYANVGRWVKCFSEYYLIFKDRTERELKAIAAEMRLANKRYSQKQKITAKEMAEYLEVCESKKFNTIQMQARENLKLVKNTNFKKQSDTPTPRRKKIDPNKLPNFGEY